MTVEDKLKETIEIIENEINILNHIIFREEQSDVCKSASYHRGERFSLVHVKQKLKEILS